MIISFTFHQRWNWILVITWRWRGELTSTGWRETSRGRLKITKTHLSCTNQRENTTWRRNISVKLHCDRLPNTSTERSELKKYSECCWHCVHLLLLIYSLFISLPTLIAFTFSTYAINHLDNNFKAGYTMYLLLLN